MTFHSNQKSDMYIILRNNKRFGRKYFLSYEAARSYVRKWIRKTDHFYGLWDVYRNPAINEYGYKIVRT